MKMNIDPVVEKAARALQEIGAREVYIFGSFASGTSTEHSDIDIAVKGLSDAVFFKAIAVVMRQCGRPVDLVSLDDGDVFARELHRRGGLKRVL